MFKMHFSNIWNILTYIAQIFFQKIVLNPEYINHRCAIEEMEKSVVTSVGSDPKLGSAWLGFGLSFWAKKLGSAQHAF